MIKNNISCTRTLEERYRCPSQYLSPIASSPFSGKAGFFRFGPDAVCWGRCASSATSPGYDGRSADMMDEVTARHGRLDLPFDPTEIIDNLTHERYLGPSNGPLAAAPSRLLRDVYYRLVRPLAPAATRAMIQRLYLRGWNKIAFPRWPLDLSADRVHETVLALLMRSLGIDRIPFVWFWPAGASAAAIVTHDVETEAGMEFCPRLMDIDESLDVPGSYQLVPEERYTASRDLLDEIRGRGHEINIQDLNHDGRLFRDRSEFLVRVRAINAYGREYGARGFRSAVLYRNLDWYDSLEFAYDMSVPCVGNLEAQRGGCCTVFPYSIGDVLELPVTTTQDYSLFHILREHSIALWGTQSRMILERHGLLSFIVHPDYVIGNREQKTYRELLAFLNRLRADRNVWIALPGEVNDWWRLRQQMTVAFRDGAWRVEGPGCERARLAYACLDAGKLSYAIENTPVEEDFRQCSAPSSAARQSRFLSGAGPAALKPVWPARGAVE